MPWLEPVGQIVTAAMIAETVYKNNGAIQKHYNRIARRLTKGSVKLPVFGAGGLGKSTFGRLMTGHNPFDLATKYEESIGINVENLNDNIPGQLLVAPGQDHRIQTNWPKLFNIVNTGQSIGVINMVAYGYHALGIRSHTESDLYETGMTIDDFMEKHLEDKKNKEIELLKHLVEGFSNAEKPFWMVTIINKQDLWYKEREKVRTHYQDGQYGSLISSLSSKLGKNFFRHEFLPTSLALQNMSMNGVTLAETASGYDIETHASYLGSLYSNLDSMICEG